MKQHFENVYNRKGYKILFLATLLVSGLFLTPTKVFAVKLVGEVFPKQAFEYEDTYYVTNVEELNEAFGGNHLIDGQTLVLQSDVELEQSILLENYAGNNCIINLNGNTIKVLNKYYFIYLRRALNPEKDFVQFIGKGNIISESATLFYNDMRGYRIILSGDITYKAGAQFFEGLDDLTIENGDFEMIPLDNYIDFVDFEGAFGKKVEISGGRFRNQLRIQSDECSISGGTFDKRVIVVGNSVISGGIMKDCLIIGRRGIIKENACIKNGLYIDEGDECTIKGGYISGKKYAIYILSDGEDPDQDYVTLNITGGTIESRSKNGYGIYCEGTPPCRVTIKNCTIRSKNGNGKSAIYLKDAQSVKLKADAGKKTLIKGFKYGLVDKNGGSVRIDKKAVVKASLTKKKYTSKDKLGKTIKGNLTIYSE